MSLTELFKASGKPTSMNPSQWKHYAGADFIKKVQGDMGSAHIAIYAKKGGVGGGGATLAHWQIGLAYAK